MSSNKPRATRANTSKDNDLRREVDQFNSLANNPVPLEKLTKFIKLLFSEENNSDINTNDSTMTSGAAPVALHHNQVVSLKDAIQVVPEFDGSNIPLREFLEGCAEALLMIEPAAEGNLLRLIRVQITGEARRTIAGEKFATVKDLAIFLKSIYAAEKSVTQLIGELGSQYQKENETVISFINRLKDISVRIIDSKRAADGADVNEAEFKVQIEKYIFECIKSGLRSEIEQRVEEKTDLKKLITEAVAIEKQLDARKTLRSSSSISSVDNRFNLRKKITFVCQMCREEGHEAAECKLIRNFQRKCDYCMKTGHTIEFCRQKENDSKPRCQICSRPGHLAPQCYKIKPPCQLCNKPGHTAIECINKKPQISCQLCNETGHLATQCLKNLVKINYCTVCEKPGHNTNKCFYLNQSGKREDPMASRSKLSCQLCEKIGHTAATCSLNENKSDLVCRYCKNTGHQISECIKLKLKEQISGNANQPPKASAISEGQQHQQPMQRSNVHATSLDDLIASLIPL